jgi:ferric-chelate reductase [NAD(P)H]
VNVLNEDAAMTFIGRFGFKSGRDIEKFDGITYRVSSLGNPILKEHSIAFLEAKVDKLIDMGSHTIFIGEVVDCDIISDGEPMTYAYYHLVKKGKSPKAAPTYIEE